MKAEIISIGTELLLGDIVDTDSHYLASQLPALGIDLYWVIHVGDNRGRIVEALRRAWERSDIIITTGGLGPTEDDITRESIAELFGEKMEVVPDLEGELSQFFRRMGVQMPARNLKQATLIPSARAIPNPLGTAPGWWVEREGKVILAMPGPPREMERMWQHEALPRLKEKRLTGEIILSRTIKTYGLGEATVDEMVSPLLSSTNPTIGIYAKPDGIQLRLTAKAAGEEQAGKLIAGLETRVRSILGNNIWGIDNDTIESVVGSLLREKGLTLAVMESCTGGLLASTITDVPGCSHYFKGGIVSYSAAMKIASGVDAALIEKHGTVHPEVAKAMATAARQRTGADIGIGITGVAGPSGTEGKPAGAVHIGIDYLGRTKSVSANYPPRRFEVKRRAVLTALSHLRLLLLE